MPTRVLIQPARPSAPQLTRNQELGLRQTRSLDTAFPSPINNSILRSSRASDERDTVDDRVVPPTERTADDIKPGKQITVIQEHCLCGGFCRSFQPGRESTEYESFGIATEIARHRTVIEQCIDIAINIACRLWSASVSDSFI